MSYKLHLANADTLLDQLEQERASDDGMPEPLERTEARTPTSIHTAYEQGRAAVSGSVGAIPKNPYRGHSRLHESWDNGRGDELESFA